MESALGLTGHRRRWGHLLVGGGPLAEPRAGGDGRDAGDALAIDPAPTRIHRLDDLPILPQALVSTRVYYAIPASGAGTATVNYNETQYGYNAVGNPEWTETPAGTITWDVLNAQDQTMSTWEGTNDTDATATDPTGGTTGQAAGNNMVEVAWSRLRPDGDVTSMTECPIPIPRTIARRRMATIGRAQTYVVNPPDAEGDVSYTMTTYDNLGEATETQTYLYQGSELAAALADATAGPPRS